MSISRQVRYATATLTTESEHRTSLHLLTPENGNFLRTSERLSAKIWNFSSNLGISETAGRAKKPRICGLFRQF